MPPPKVHQVRKRLINTGRQHHIRNRHEAAGRRPLATRLQTSVAVLRSILTAFSAVVVAVWWIDAARPAVIAR